MLFKIETVNTFQSVYEINAFTEQDAIDLLMGERPQKYLIENKITSISIKTINKKYKQTDLFYD